MSFILDAIAKSERERQQQEIPDARILATPVRNTRQPQRFLPYLLAGALLLNVIVLLVWMQTDQSPLDQFQHSINGATELSPAQKVTSDNKPSINETANLPITEPAYPLNRAVENSGAKTLDPGLAPPASKMVLPEELTARPTSGKPARIDNSQGRLEANSQSTRPPNVADAKDGNGGDNSIVIEPDNQPGVTGSADSTKQTIIRHVVEPLPRKISRLSELPDDVRRDLPSVTFSGHLYSKNLASRYVLVEGGRTVFSGQQITDELILHEVTPTGAIVNFRGFLIEVGVLQNWSLK